MNILKNLPVENELVLPPHRREAPPRNRAWGGIVDSD